MDSLTGSSVESPNTEAAAQRVACYNKALDLLSRRTHFVGELTVKLARRGFDPELVDDVCRKLAAKGLLDDRSAAAEFVRSRQRRQGEAARRIVFELRKRGVASDLAAEAVADIEPETELEMARARAESLRSRGSDDDRIARHLDRKGYSRSVILTVLEGSRASR